MRHFSGDSLCLINSTNLPPPTVSLRVLALTGPALPRVSRRWDCWVRPWLLHQDWPWGSGQQDVKGRIISMWLEQAVLCARAALTGKAWPLIWQWGGLQQPQSLALQQEGSRLAGKANVPTAPGMARFCAAATALAPIWAHAVLAQPRAECGTQEAWVTSGTDTCPVRC